MLNNPKYDLSDIKQDLINHNVDLSKFENLVKRMSGGAVTNQSMFEFIYESIVCNNYNVDLFFSDNKKENIMTEQERLEEIALINKQYYEQLAIDKGYDL